MKKMISLIELEELLKEEPDEISGYDYDTETKEVRIFCKSSKTAEMIEKKFEGIDGVSAIAARKTPSYKFK